MEACRSNIRRLFRAAAYAFVLGSGASSVAEPVSAVRLPAWIEANSSHEVSQASYDKAPRPPAVGPRFNPRAPVEPPPREPRPLKTPTDQAGERLVRQLENAASGAETSHALGRLLRRYDETRKQLEDGADPALLARADRVGAWAYESRGRLRAEAADYDRATTDYRNALLLDAKNEGARHALAVSLAEAGVVDEALEEFSLLLQINPTLVAARRNRAQLHLGRGRPDSAIADLDVALAQPAASDRERANLLRLRGVALHTAGRLRAAAVDLNEAVRFNPNDAAAYTARGHVFAEGGFYDQAISDYAAALDAEARHIEAYRSLAWVLATCPHARLRDPATAVEASWRARRLLGHDDFLTLDAAAAAHAAAGDYAEAVKLQQRALVAAESPPADAKTRLALYQAGRPYVAK